MYDYEKIKAEVELKEKSINDELIKKAKKLGIKVDEYKLKDEQEKPEKTAEKENSGKDNKPESKKESVENPMELFAKTLSDYFKKSMVDKKDDNKVDEEAPLGLGT